MQKANKNINTDQHKTAKTFVLLIIIYTTNGMCDHGKPSLAAPFPRGDHTTPVAPCLIIPTDFRLVFVELLASGFARSLWKREFSGTDSKRDL